MLGFRRIPSCNYENTTVTIPEWKRDIRIMLEEAGFWGKNGFRYVNGRQAKLLTVPRVKDHQGN